MASNRRKKTYLIGIAVALLLPLFSWFIFSNITKGAIQIPKHYGINYIDTIQGKDGQIVYDTVYRIVNDLTLTNQLGQKISLNHDLRGKILVLNFFNTQNSKVCSTMAENLHKVQVTFQKEDNLDWAQFISITVNPSIDKVAEIRAFADKHHANHDHWWFLTGDATTILNYAHNALGLPQTTLNQANNQLLNTIVLVDTFRHIRGYFNGLDTADLVRLSDDIAILTLEKN